MTQPNIGLYYQNIAHYEQFLAFAFGAGMILAYHVLTFLSFENDITRFIPTGWVLLIVVALGARLPLLMQPLWYDEAYSKVLVQTDMLTMLNLVTSDVHPPLYYAILKVFGVLGFYTDFALRLPALISGLLIIPVMGLIAQHHGVNKWSVMWLVALMPSAVYYSTEARYPMMLALMSAIAYLSYLRRFAWGLGLSLFIVSLLHVNAWFYVVMLASFWFYQQRDKAFASFMGLAGIALWFPIALMQSQQVSNGFWLTQYIPIRHVIEMTVGSAWLNTGWAIFPIALVSAGIVAGVWAWRSNISWLWFAIVAGVPALQSLVGVVWHPVYLPRTMLFSALMLIIPMAWFISKSRWAVGVILLSLFAGIFNLIQVDRTGGAAEAIALCRGFDLVYATNVHSAILALAHTNAEVLIAPVGASSVAQEMNETAQQLLFESGTDIVFDAETCLFSQISVFNTLDEIRNLNELLIAPHRSTIFQQSPLGYYFVAVFDEVLK